MKLNIFEHSDYKTYLRTWIQAQPRRGHGYKSKLANAAACNTTYITQILHGSAHFSLEQAEQVTHFLGLSRDETLFFLLLLQTARAGTNSLRSLLQQQIDQAKENHFNLKNRLEFKKTLRIEDQAVYYSAWYYPAIHVVLSMPRFQRKEALAQYFDLPMNTVSEVLVFLVSVGLATETQGRYEVGSVNIHLGKDSPMISKHHTNWRMRSIDSLERLKSQDLHYSSVITIAASDETRVRSVLVKAIESIRAIVKESPEEGAYCYTLDFFSLEKQR